MKLAFRTLMVLFTVSFVVTGLAFSDRVVSIEMLNAINDFAITCSADPIDINKDGVVDNKDKEAAIKGYAILIKYSDDMPSYLKQKMDWDRDGKVTGLDLALVTANISRTIALTRRINNPVLNIVSVPNFNYVFLESADLRIDEERSQIFESPDYSEIYKQPVIYKTEPSEPYVAKNSDLTKEATTVFCDIAAISESVSGPDFNVGMSANSEIINAGKWLTEYGSDFTRKVGSKGYLNIGRSPYRSDEQFLSEFDMKYAGAMEFVDNIKRSHPFKFASWSVNKYGGIKFVFKSGEYTILEIVIAVAPTENSKKDSPPKKMEVKAVLKTLNKNFTLIECITESRKYDVVQGRLVESYVGTATEIDESGTLREDVVNGSIYGSNDLTGTYETVNKYDGSGTLISSESTVSVLNNQSGNESIVRIERAISDTGEIERTYAYDDKGEELVELSGEGNKELSAIVESVGISRAMEYYQENTKQENSELFQKKAIESRVLDNMKDTLFSGEMADQSNMDTIAKQLIKQNE